MADAEMALQFVQAPECTRECLTDPLHLLRAHGVQSTSGAGRAPCGSDAIWGG